MRTPGRKLHTDRVGVQALAASASPASSFACWASCCLSSQAVMGIPRSARRRSRGRFRRLDDHVRLDVVARHFYELSFKLSFMGKKSDELLRP